MASYLKLFYNLDAMKYDTPFCKNNYKHYKLLYS